MKYKYKEIQGIKIAYRNEGEGKPLFMIPPWTSGSLAYERLVALLDKKKYRLIRMQLPGWGGAIHKTTIKDDSFDGYLNLISDFINSFDYDDYDILGYSIGVTFILHGITNNLIAPDKMVLVSGFQRSSDIFESELNSRLKFYPMVKDSKFLHWIMKSLMLLFYIYEAYTGKPYKDKEMRKMFFRVIFENVKFNMNAVMQPLYTLGDIDTVKLRKYNSDAIMIYNKNEPACWQKSSKEIAKDLNIEPIVVDASDHRHLSFEPEKSVEYIDNFLRG